MTPNTRTVKEKSLSEGVEEQIQKTGSTAGKDSGESAEEQIVEPEGRIAQETGRGNGRPFWISGGS